MRYSCDKPTPCTAPYNQKEPLTPTFSLRSIQFESYLACHLLWVPCPSVLAHKTLCLKKQWGSVFANPLVPN